MSAANNLEALINLEQNLKSQYEEKLAAQTQKAQNAESAQTTLKATVERQLAHITELTASRADSKRLEQENREMNNRVGNLQKEIDLLRTKAKSAQKELLTAKATIKTLNQLDAEKLKKNLIATKTTLLEQRNANEVLTKKNNKLKAENSEFKYKNEALTKELEDLKPKETQGSAEEINTTENKETKAKKSTRKASTKVVANEELEATA